MIEYRFWTCDKQEYWYQIKSHKYCDVYINSISKGLLHIARLDLTLMFGAGNEPQTKEEMEKLFPQNYCYHN